MKRGRNADPTGPTECRIYRRVSTDEQVETRSGLDAQLDACTRYAERHEWVICGDYAEEDGVSGSVDPRQRPKLALLLDDLRKSRKGQVVLVAKRDRLARDRNHIYMFEGWLRAEKSRLVSAAGEGTEADPNDPMGVLMRGMVDLFAEYERLVIGFRTAGALQAKRSRNERAGRVPYGYELWDDGKRSKAKKGADGETAGNLPIALRPCPEETTILVHMRRLREDHRYSFAQIAEHLNRCGFRARGGKPWQGSSIHYILTHREEITTHVESHSGPEAAAPGEAAAEPGRSA